MKLFLVVAVFLLQNSIWKYSSIPKYNQTKIYHEVNTIPGVTIMTVANVKEYANGVYKKGVEIMVIEYKKKRYSTIIHDYRTGTNCTASVVKQKVKKLIQGK